MLRSQFHTTMPAPRTLKAAVIGLGVGAHQARTLAAHPNVELLWLCDLNDDTLATLGHELPQARRTHHDQTVLTDPAVDLVCIASYDAAHHRQVITALEHGKHVYVEKPMCLTKAEAQSIRRTLTAHPHLQLSSNLVLRTCPLFSRVRAAVQAREMGALYHLDADYLWGRKEKLTSGWRAAADTYSIIHGAAVHMVDLVLWITGMTPVSVRALGSRIAVADSPQRHNDFAVMLLSFANQMTAKIAAHGGCVHPHFHTLRVFGTQATLLHETSGTHWLDSADPSQPPRPEHADYPAKQHRSQALVSFVEALLDANRRPLIPQEDVFQVMSVCLAAEHAATTGRTVDIDYL